MRLNWVALVLGGCKVDFKILGGVDYEGGGQGVLGQG